MKTSLRKITSTPWGPAFVGVEYTYTLTAEDPDSDTVSFVLKDGPDGATVSEINGAYTLRWTPSAEGGYCITIVAGDSRGLQALQSFTLPVVDAVPEENQSPTIQSVPVGPAYVDEIWQYHVEAFDPDGDQLTLILAQAPDAASLSDDGIITWTPSAVDIGEHAFTIVAQDGRGGEMTQSFTLEVVAVQSDAPTITSKPTSSSYTEKQYVYQVTAESDSTPLTFSVDKATGNLGAAINQDGRFTWTPQQDGKYDITILVTDDNDNTTSQQFTLLVLTEDSNDAPQINSLPPTPALLNRIYRYQVQAHDPNGDNLTYQRSCPFS